MSNHVPAIVCVLFAAALFTVCAHAQDATIPVNEGTPKSLTAPLRTRTDAGENFLSPISLSSLGCLQYQYYNAAAATVELQDSVPTRKWAVKMDIGSFSSAAYSRVWRVATNFRWVPKLPGPGDTLHIFMREVTAPYNEIYHAKYIIRLGENVGEIEVDPPVIGSPVPMINPKRNIYLGVYITGGYGNQVTWRIKTPAQYNHSYVFVNPQNPVPASPGSVFGANGDLMFGAVFCFYIPVELSLFSGYASSDAVQLDWVTESETNSYQFEVQRTTGSDGVWQSRGYVASKGNSQVRQQYTFFDPLPDSPAQTYWYRLRQTDFDGKHEYFGPIKVENSDPASGYAIRGAYPNPVAAGSGASIGYDVPAESHVTLSVYDALGREAAVLVDGTVPAGRHEALWYPASGLAEGTYYIVIKTAVSRESKRISLFR